MNNSINGCFGHVSNGVVSLFGGNNHIKCMHNTYLSSLLYAPDAPADQHTCTHYNHYQNSCSDQAKSHPTPLAS